MMGSILLDGTPGKQQQQRIPEISLQHSYLHQACCALYPTNLFWIMTMTTSFRFARSVAAAVSLFLLMLTVGTTIVAVVGLNFECANEKQAMGTCLVTNGVATQVGCQSCLYETLNIIEFASCDSYAATACNYLLGNCSSSCGWLTTPCLEPEFNDWATCGADNGNCEIRCTGLPPTPSPTGPPTDGDGEQTTSAGSPPLLTATASPTTTTSTVGVVLVSCFQVLFVTVAAVAMVSGVNFMEGTLPNLGFLSL